MEREWIHLVEKLKKEGHESPYLDRLKARLPGQALTATRREAAMRELEVEIAQEMASSLGRAQDKVNVSLLKLELLGREVDTLEVTNARHDLEAQLLLDKRLVAYDLERERAIKALWELRVHREAIGIRRNDMLAEQYPIPRRRQRPPR